MFFLLFSKIHHIHFQLRTNILIHNFSLRPQYTDVCAFISCLAGHYHGFEKALLSPASSVAQGKPSPPFPALCNTFPMLLKLSWIHTYTYIHSQKRMISVFALCRSSLVLDKIGFLFPVFQGIVCTTKNLPHFSHTFPPFYLPPWNFRCYVCEYTFAITLEVA